MKPVLYTFRRCPYAIRARLAIQVSGVDVELQEVSLRDKPAEMLARSPKGTVPVLVTGGGDVIDESLDIMLWALGINDPQGWLGEGGTASSDARELIALNDSSFKNSLDRYKYSARFPEPPQHYRAEGEVFLAVLEARLCSGAHLAGDSPGLADMAILPFVRQFAHVDRDWFYASSYRNVITWLDRFLESPLFAEVMRKR